MYRNIKNIIQNKFYTFYVFTTKSSKNVKSIKLVLILINYPLVTAETVQYLKNIIVYIYIPCNILWIVRKFFVFICINISQNTTQFRGKNVFEKTISKNLYLLLLQFSLFSIHSSNHPFEVMNPIFETYFHI